MAELRTAIVVTLAGNLTRQAAKYNKSLQRLGSQGSRHIRKIGGAVSKVSAGLSRLGNRYTALAGGLTFVGASKQIIDFDQRLASVGARAGKTGKELDAFVKSTKARLFDLANDPKLNVDPGALLSGLDAVITKTGNRKLALENLPNIAHLIRGGEAQGGDSGGLIADLFQKLNVKSKEMVGALGDLTAQGDKGSFEIGDFSTQGERLTAAYALTGRTGRKAVRELGTLAQMFKRTTGSTEMSTTAVERFLSTLTSEKT